MNSVLVDVSKVLEGIVHTVAATITNENVCWSKSLELMPIVTIREINEHRANTGKSGEPIAKTLERGKKFKNERYIDANKIFTSAGSGGFSVKHRVHSKHGQNWSKREEAKINPAKIGLRYRCSERGIVHMQTRCWWSMPSRSCLVTLTCGVQSGSAEGSTKRTCLHKPVTSMGCPWTVIDAKGACHVNKNLSAIRQAWHCLYIIGSKS